METRRRVKDERKEKEGWIQNTSGEGWERRGEEEGEGPQRKGFPPTSSSMKKISGSVQELWPTPSRPAIQNAPTIFFRRKHHGNRSKLTRQTMSTSNNKYTVPKVEAIGKVFFFCG